MSQKSQYSIKLIIIIIAITLLVLMASFIIGKEIFFKQVANLACPTCPSCVAKQGSYDEGYQAGLAFAHQRLKDEGVIQPSIDLDLSGLVDTTEKGVPPLLLVGKNVLYNVTVKSAKGRNIEIEFKASLFDIFQEGMLIRTVKIPEGVRIEKHIPKNSESYNKEIIEYNKKAEDQLKQIQAGTISKEDVYKDYPLSYTIQYLEPSDLKTGDNVNVYSNTDISKSDIFDATSVEFIIPPEIDEITAKLIKEKEALSK